MTEPEIFKYLFTLATQSEDKGGIVAACLVRDGEVIAEGFSTNDGIHAEYAVLLDMQTKNIVPNNTDILYTSVVPCGKRTPGGPGEKYRDCTSNIINSGIKNVVYGAFDTDASSGVSQRFKDSGVNLKQTKSSKFSEQSKKIFNNSVSSSKDLI